MKSITKLATVCAFASICLNTLADDADISITYSPRSGLISTVTPAKIISKDDIEQINPTSLSELLNTVATFSVYSTGGEGSKSNIRAFGLEDEQILILVNGSPLNSATEGETQLEWLDINTVETVEYFGLGQGVIFGSGSAGGVINIITSGSTKNFATLGIGSNNSIKTSVQVSSNDEGNVLTLNVHGKRTSGIDSREGSQTDKDAFQQYSSSISYQLSTGFIESFTATKSVSDAEIDNDYSDQNNVESSVESLNLKYGSLVTGPIEGEYSRSVVKTEAYTDDKSSTNIYKTINNTANLFTQVGTSRIGFEVSNQEYQPGGTAYYSADNSSNLFAILGAYEKAISELAIIGTTVRLENHDEFGFEKAFNISLSKLLDETTTIGLTASQSYRYPSLSDRFSGGTYFNTLKPERVNTISGQYTFEKPNYQFTAEIFGARMNDTLYWSGSTQNIGTNLSHGMNVDIKIARDLWLHHMGYSYVFSHLKFYNDREMPFTPEHTFAYQVERSINNGSLFFKSRYQTEMLGGYSGTAKTTAFGMFDIGMKRTIKGINFVLDCKNCGDRDLDFVSSGTTYFSEGRTFALEAQLEF